MVSNILCISGVSQYCLVFYEYSEGIAMVSTILHVKSCNFIH